MTDPGDPHAGAPVLRAGENPAEALAVLLLLHGRGAPATDMLGLGSAIAPPGWTVLAPQAADHAWYPDRFTAPLERNQPWLDSALGLIAAILEELEDAGFGADRVALGGFSQGACLALEYAARAPDRYGALIGLSGGLIGPPGMSFARAGSLDGTPVLLGCSDVDPHIPVDRVYETSAALEEMGAHVDTRIYPEMGHAVNEDELEGARALLADITRGV